MVISDWADVASLFTAYHVAPDYEHAIALAVNAGVDVAMEPYDADSFEKNLTAAVKDKLVTTSRVEQAAYRVLLMKFRVGVFDHPYVDSSKADATVLNADLPLARKAADESMVLLRKENNALPLARDAHVVVTGPSADPVANQLGGWSIGWQGVPAGSPEKAVTMRA